MECISKVAPNFSSLYNSFKEDQGIYELDFKTIESKHLLGESKTRETMMEKLFIQQRFI